jgi:hypothetical protein
MPCENLSGLVDLCMLMGMEGMARDIAFLDVLCNARSKD